jgi:hypothetical protein
MVEQRVEKTVSVVTQDHFLERLQSQSTDAGSSGVTHEISSLFLVSLSWNAFRNAPKPLWGIAGASSSPAL